MGEPPASIFLRRYETAEGWISAATRLDPCCHLLAPARKSLAAPGTSGPLFTLS